MPEHPAKPMTKRPADAVPEPKYSMVYARLASVVMRGFDIHDEEKGLVADYLASALRVVECAKRVEALLHGDHSGRASEETVREIRDSLEALAAALSEWKE